MDWVIRYADGSQFSSDDGGPEQAPRTGVLRVYHADEATGVSVEMAREGYWVWRDGRWSGIDTPDGLWDYLWHQPGMCLVLSGRTIRDTDWEAFVVEEAKLLTGRDKSAWRARERR